MGKRIKFSFEIKLEAVREFMNGAGSAELARKYGCSYIQINRWVNRYKASGEKALYDTHRNRSYSKEEKRLFRNALKLLKIA